MVNFKLSSMVSQGELYEEWRTTAKFSKPDGSHVEEAQAGTESGATEPASKANATVRGQFLLADSQAIKRKLYPIKA